MNSVPLFAFAVVGFAGLVIGLFTTKRLWAVADTPTIPAGHAFPGRIEVFGQAQLRPGSGLTSPLSGASCAWWKVEIQREEKTGKSKTWNTKGTIVSQFEVLVRDESGYVRVDLGDTPPKRCRSETIDRSSLPNITPAMLRDVSRGALLHTLQLPVEPHRNLLAAVIGAIGGDTYGPDLNLATASGQWRAVEHRVEVGDDLYVLGNARNVDAGPLLLRKNHGPLYVYRGREQGLLTYLRWAARVALTCFVVGSAGTFGYLRGNHATARTALDHFSMPHAILAAWLAVLVIVLIQAVRIRNRIVAAREQVLASWSLIDVASSKRAALIPALHDVVRAAASHEQSTLEHLTMARTQSIASGGPLPDAARLQAASQAHIESRAALNNMRALQERYPAIRVQPNFEKLFHELVELEDGVAAARGYYVDAQTVLRNRLQTFPDSWLAEFAGDMPPELIDHDSGPVPSDQP